MVQCGRKANTALFSSSTTAPGGQLASSLLSFSLGNNPSEHFNIALSVSFVSHTICFLPAAFLSCHLKTNISPPHLSTIKW